MAWSAPEHAVSATNARQSHLPAGAVLPLFDVVRIRLLTPRKPSRAGKTSAAGGALHRKRAGDALPAPAREEAPAARGPRTPAGARPGAGPTGTARPGRGAARRLLPRLRRSRTARRE